MSEGHEVANRIPITAAIMLATLMNSLDGTIANVALPHIQGSLSASPDQIAWVLTSYIVAAAMVTPVSGWLANRFGVKTIFLVAITGFTGASMLCGVAANLPQLVLFRMAQGAFGAFTMPLSQSVLLDINPPQNHARAMSIWAMGAILGPILGPVVGGYITDQFSWRWCFYINLPLGALALLGTWIFMPSQRSQERRHFDTLGFASLIVTVASVQLMLDRGPSQDWLSSPEIWTDISVAVIALWIFVTHTITTSHPFIERSLFRDRNLMATCVFGFIAGIITFGSLAVMPILQQSVLGYPVLTSGLVSMPRGLGMMLAMWSAPRLSAWVDMRLLLVAGLIINAVSFWQMMGFDLTMSTGPVMVSGFVQGIGHGLLFVPMTTLAFATVNPAQRPDAAAIFNLMRSLGGSVGISILQALATANTQVMHAALAGRVILSDSMVRWGLAPAFSPDTLPGALALDEEINRQARMIAYLDDFRLMFLLSLLAIPLVLLLRRARSAPGAPAHAAVE
ncbi:MAG: drug resistance transporter, EmrB/QacA subfamily [Phenylobacterium sp.]|nr:drug resistance transporter, EmrB/QacA subfamily [Phenylobacterium sp.]